MGLFTKKPPCPICGGKISWFLPMKIEGEYICDDCSGKIDMDDDIRSELTMAGFNDYLAFYEENQALRSRFSTTDEVTAVGSFAFDMPHRLFCLSTNLDKTVFEGEALKAFRISEDSSVLLEGSDAGLQYYESTVPARVMAMEPQIQMMVHTQRMHEQMERMRDDEHRHTYCPPMDIPEPFHRFRVELWLEHPYRRHDQCDLYAPTFNNSFPSVADYLAEYQRDVSELERLANLLQQMAFPGAGAVTQTQGNIPAPQSTPAEISDAQRTIEDIKRFKELLDSGIISQEEFDAKKKQLLGI